METLSLDGGTNCEAAPWGIREARVKMEELLELRSFLEQGRYAEALTLLGEMEEMSRDDKINKVRSYIVILLLHLIKRHAEQRTTRSWEITIRNALSEITYTNKRRKAQGWYLSELEIGEAIEEAWKIALRRASLEAFEGNLHEDALAEMINTRRIKEEAMQLIKAEAIADV